MSIPPTIVRKIWYHTETIINAFFQEGLSYFQPPFIFAIVTKNISDRKVNEVPIDNR
jgi:hypothetical protein